MASVVKIKRSAISGRAPNTSILSTGELALNLADKKLYSSDGSSIFEIGANVSYLTVNNYSFPLTDGASGQVLVTDGSGNLTFQNQTGSGGGASVTTGTTPPSSPSTGDLWFDTDEAILYVYLDGAWVQSVPGSTGGGGGTASVAVGNSAPSTASEGDMWYDTDVAHLFFYIGTQWVQITSDSASGGGETANLEGYTTNTYVTSTFTTNTEFQSYVANTNPRFAQYLQVANVDSYGFATETYVDTSVAALVNSAPTTLNTLDELAQALGDDANFATSVATTLGTKASNTYVNTLLANTNSYIASVSDAQSQYLQVANTTALVAPYLEVANSTSFLVQSDVDQYLQVANSTSFITSTALSPYLEVANSTNFLVQADVDQYLQVANVASYIPANTSTTSASLSGNTVTFARADSSTFDLDLSAFSGGGGASLEVSNTAPLTGNTGDIWYDSNTGVLFVYNEGAWIQASIIESTGVSNNYLTSTYVTNTVFNSTVSQYLQVANIAGYIPANTSTTSATLSGNTVTFTRADATTYDLDLSAFSGGGGGASVTASATPPVSPALGDLWYDTDTGVLNVYYDSFWVEVRASSQQILIESGATAPTGGVDGLLWYNTNTSELYAYYGTSWVQLTDSTIIANTSTASASLTGNTVIFTRADSSTYDLDLSAFSPDLTGYANTLYVDTAVASIVNSAPTTLNTLVELSNALGNDENFSTTVTTLIGEKAGNSFVTSTYVTNATFNSTVSQYLQVANVAANTSTSNAVYTVANSTLTFTRADNSTFDLLLPSASVEVANVAPVTGNEGDMWFDTTTGILNVYLDGFWVESSASASDGGGVQVSTSNTAPLAPGEGDFWFNPSDATLYIHRDNVWVETVPISLLANTSTASASYNTGVITFTRADATTYTVDISTLINDANTSVANATYSHANGTIVFTRGDNTTFNVTIDKEVTISNTAPTGIDGDLWFDSTSGVLNIQYDGYWVEATASASGGGDSSVTINAFAPTHSDGTLWYNSVEDIMYISANSVWKPIVRDLDELPDVDTTGKANNDVLVWNTANSKWEASSDYATKVYVDTSISNLVNNAPQALDTLYELSNALGNNENFATDILVAIANTETTNADFYSSNSTIVFTRGDTTTYDVNLSTFASSNTSTANAVLSNTTITFTRADSSTYDLDLSTLDLGSSVNTGTTPPANPAEGDMWYNTDLASLTIYLGSAWVELFAETSPAMSVSATPPTAVDGDLWFDTERVNLNVYYDGVWIELLGGGGGGGASVTIDSTPPASSNEGDLYFDDELATLYIYYDSSWVEVLPNNDTSPVEIDLDTYTANGSVSTFAYTSTASSATDLIVTVDGIVQRPTTDYTLSNQNVVFGSNPSNGSVIAIRGLQGMGQGISNTYLQSTLSNYVLTAEQVTGITYAEATSSQSANTGYKYIVDTSSTAVTITLPASASLGEEVGIMDGVGNASVNNITVARNGHNIQGSAEDLTIDVDRAAFTLVYYNATQGWLLTEV